MHAGIEWGSSAAREPQPTAPSTMKWNERIRMTVALITRLSVRVSTASMSLVRRRGMLGLQPLFEAIAWIAALRPKSRERNPIHSRLTNKGASYSSHAWFLRHSLAHPVLARLQASRRELTREWEPTPRSVWPARAKATCCAGMCPMFRSPVAQRRWRTRGAHRSRFCQPLCAEVPTTEVSYAARERGEAGGRLLEVRGGDGRLAYNLTWDSQPISLAFAGDGTGLLGGRRCRLPKLPGPGREKALAEPGRMCFVVGQLGCRGSVCSGLCRRP